MSEASSTSGLGGFRVLLATQRGRLLAGMAEAVAANGYAGTAVADVLEHSRLARKTFYRHFANKEECFLAAYDEAVDHVARDVAESFLAPAPDEAARARAAFDCFVGYVLAEPAFAQTCLVEVLAAGPRALERRAAAMARFTSFLDAAARRAPAGSPATGVLSEAIVGGVQSVVTARLLAGRADELPDMVDDLFHWAIAPLGLGAPLVPDAVGAG